MSLSLYPLYIIDNPIGIPSRPGPPVVSGSGNPVTVVVTTEHSGVRDSAVDEFHFILGV